LDKDLTVMKVIDDRELNMEDRLQLLEQVWNFSITPPSLIRRILKSQNIHYIKNDNSKETDEWKFVVKDAETKKEIIIWGEENLAYKTCNLCHWEESNEQIVAHINSKWNFTIHKRNCTVLKWVNKERLMNAYVKWEEALTLFRISMTVENKIGMMKVISETLFTMEINIDELHTKKISKNGTQIIITLEINDYEYLVVDRFIERISLILGDSMIQHKLEEITCQ